MIDFQNKMGNIANLSFHRPLFKRLMVQVEAGRSAYEKAVESGQTKETFNNFMTNWLLQNDGANAKNFSANYDTNPIYQEVEDKAEQTLEYGLSKILKISNRQGVTILM